MKRRKIKTTSDRPQPAVDDTSREQMLAWLQWNDSNGCYSDDVSDHERRPRLGYKEARALYEDAVKDLGEDDFEPLPRQKTTQEFSHEAQRKVADALNLMGLDERAFAKAYMTEHRTGQQTFARFAWAFFEELAKQEYGDLRNEDARALAKEVVEHISHVNDAREAEGLGCIGALRII